MEGLITELNGRFFCSMRKDYLVKLMDWRNSQMDVLRQWRPLTEHNQEQWFKDISIDSKQVFFAILEKKEGKKPEGNFIGYCGITNIDFKNRRGEIAFLVNPIRAKNKSIYKDDFLSTLNVLCQHGFQTLNLHKLYTETYDIRCEHIKILEAFGLHRDLVLREHEFIGGKYYNSIIHSILENEWLKIKGEWRNGVET